jgi:transposase-like protein
MYTEQFKEEMVKKMVIPGGLSTTLLSEQSGVHKATLSRWRKSYGKVEGMKDREKRRPQDWSAEERLQALKDTAKMGEEELGSYLRREGIHSVQLEQWTREFLDGQKALSGRGRRWVTSQEKKRIKELERELRRKDKALAEATALLILKKKAELIWGVVEDEEST